MVFEKMKAKSVSAGIAEYKFGNPTRISTFDQKYLKMKASLIHLTWVVKL